MYTIVFDIDDVLNDFMYRWFLWYRLHNKLCIIRKYEEIIENPPYNVLEISKERYLISIDTYRKESFYVLKPNEDIIEWFEQHGDKVESIALTSIPLDCASISAEWTLRNFGQWIRTLAVIPSCRRLQHCIEYHKNKGEFIKGLNRENILFLDDDEKNIKDVESLKLKNTETFCVKQPWNSGKKLKKVLEELTKRIDVNDD